MDLDNPTYLRSRRDFIRQAACAALGTASLTGTIRDLRIINSAMAHELLGDYKALVCIFLSGGNDANNLIVPRGTDYGNYAAIRQNLAIPESALHQITSTNSDGHDYGLHPSCRKMALDGTTPTGLHQLFVEKKLGVLFNVGTLVQPIADRAQYQSKFVNKPPQLFSHSDQVTQWQTSIPDQVPRSGWGGRIADLLHPQQVELVNSIPTAQSAKISLCTSLAGSNTFEVGNVFQQYHVSTSGAVLISTGGNNATGINRLNALKSILALDRVNLQQQAYAEVTERAIATGDLLTTAISPTASNGFWSTPFVNNSLGNQLKMVARLIQARDALSMKRQIFFCSVGGYDTHTAQVGATGGVPDQTVGAHANLISELSDGMFAFQRALEQIGISDRVTSFTASDFGRTFPTNGQGSDHGWGNHQLIMGGAVRGGQTYGTLPILSVNGPDDTGLGRWIPKIAVDQYSATLAKWFGVGAGEMSTVFPNLGRFATSDLGFMI